MDCSLPILFDQSEKPTGQVPNIDELQRPTRVTWCQHLAAASDSRRPVREAVRVVVRANEQTGAHIEGPTVHCLGNRLLAQRLETAVCFSIARGDKGLLRLNGFESRQLLGRHAIDHRALIDLSVTAIGVNRDAGYE